MINYGQEDLGVIEITCKSLSIRKYSKSEALAKDKINEKERILLSNFYIGVFLYIIRNVHFQCRTEIH